MFMRVGYTGHDWINRAGFLLGTKLLPDEDEPQKLLGSELWKRLKVLIVFIKTPSGTGNILEYPFLESNKITGVFKNDIN